MGKIILLDELTASQIAAGEVIERPASVVKELAENAVDAGATVVSVEIKAGGIKYIKVTDNGCGFLEDDAVIAFDKHATSKIMNADDLFGVNTLGFRGEALASIAAVSDVTLISRAEDAENGFKVNIKGGKLIDSSVYASAKGSTFIVRDLFYNTPARYKFLKKDNTEAGYVADIMQKLAMAHPGVSFKLVCDGKISFHSPGNNDMMSCIHSIYGKSVTDFLCEVKYELEGISVSGYVGVREAAYGNRNRQHFFVNGRYVKSKVITSALDEAYKTVTMKGKFPFAVLTVKVNPMTLDVNVHPTKIEVRFSDEQSVFRAVYHAVHIALFGDDADNKSRERAGSQWKMPAEKVSFTRENARASNHKKDEINTLLQFMASAPDVKKTDPIVGEVKNEQAAETEKKEIESHRFLLLNSYESKSYDAEIPAENKQPAVDSINEAAAEKTAETNTVTKRYNDTSIYTESTVIGQLFETYILLEYRDKLVLLDQHAAHERIMYERIKANLEKNEAESLMMLLPVTLTLSPAESRFLKENIDFFVKLGFEIDEFGMNTFAVRSIPMILEGSDIENFIVDGINKAMQNGKGSLYDDRTIFTMACKAAVKGGDDLTKDEIDALFKLMDGDLGLKCPHGRPVVVKMTKTELEKMFKRIV